MLSHLDESLYRDVTSRLVSASATGQPDDVIRLLHQRYGSWSALPVKIGNTQAHLYEHSGLVVRAEDGRIKTIWAPTATPDTAIDQWRIDMDRALESCGTVSFQRVVLCNAPLVHTWKLPQANLTLSPMPASAPKAWPWCTDHPSVLRAEYERCNDIGTNAGRANRAAEAAILLLNAITPIGCHETMSSHQGWGWNRIADKSSKWVEHTYFATEMLDEELMAKTREDAPLGVFVPDFEFYYAQRVTSEEGVAFPHSLDETLAAASALPQDKRRALLRAARWIKAGDRAGRESQSLQFLSIAVGLESLAHARGATTKPREAFKLLLTDLLPGFTAITKPAAEMYALRSALAHGGKLFPGDWIDRPMSSEEKELSSLYQMTWLCRLVVANWIRAESGLPLIGASQ